jgi:hypothetical protein
MVEVCTLHKSKPSRHLYEYLELGKEVDPSCGRLYTGRFRFFWSRTTRGLQRSYFAASFPLLVCRLEVRNFLHRIAFRFGIPCHQQVVELGRVYHQDDSQAPEVCIRRRDCSRDIENFSALNPTATVIDWAHFREGWEAGAKWAAHNSCSCISESSTKLLSRFQQFSTLRDVRG